MHTPAEFIVLSDCAIRISYPPQWHYPDKCQDNVTEPLSLCIIVRMLNTWLGSDTYQFPSQWFDSSRVSFIGANPNYLQQNARTTLHRPARLVSNYDIKSIELMSVIVNVNVIGEQILLISCLIDRFLWPPTWVCSCHYHKHINELNFMYVTENYDNEAVLQYL